MTKAFKSAIHKDASLIVKKNADFGTCAQVYRNGVLSDGVTLKPADAPAIALAFLSAANIIHHDPEDTPYDSTQRTENMGPLNMAAFYLAQHVNQAEKAAYIAAKEAADREALEKDAFKLANAWRAAHGCEPFPTWDSVTNPGGFLALARKSREMYGATS